MQLKDLESLKALQLRKGSVFKGVLYPSDNVTPKGVGATSRMKYFVIVGIDEEGNIFASSLINTEVNINFARDIAHFQHCIYPDRYEFMGDKYRYVDCYSIIKLTKERILNHTEYIGCLEDDDLAKVKSLLHESPVIYEDIIQTFNI